MDIEHSAVAAVQARGSRRQQEDRCRIEPIEITAGQKGMLLVLCDGMGGAVAGEVASQLVADEVVTVMARTDSLIPLRLTMALEHAGMALAARMRDQPELVGMGTTLVAAVVMEHTLSWLSVGDSLLWVVREGGLHRLNTDHSRRAILRRQVDSGEITAAQAAGDQSRNILLSAVCGTPPPLIDLAQEPYRLQPGDQILLASDGIETLGEDEICAALQRNQPPQAALKTLLTAIERQHTPHQDNVSAILMPIGELSPQQKDVSSATSDQEGAAAGHPGNRRNSLLAALAVLVAVVLLAAVYIVAGR
ncbi:MAG: PP2C family protein-serine/threonine phosphatase [Desulfopila sp.]